MTRIGAFLLTALLSLTATAQTYVRPSKGTAVAVFDIKNAPAATVTYTSAVYDMSSFVEGDFDIVATSATKTIVLPFTTGQFGRYVKIRVTQNYSAINQTLAILEVLTAETPAGDYRLSEAPESVQSIAIGFAESLTSFSLSMTPLPYFSIQYVRSQKGPRKLVISGTIGPGGSGLGRGTLVDLQGYAGAQVELFLTPSYGFTCGSFLSVNADGRMNLSDAAYPLTDANRVFYTEYSTKYVINTQWRFLSFEIAAPSTPVPCAVQLYVTPLPQLDETIYTEAVTSSYDVSTATLTAVDPAATYRRSGKSRRVQNVGTGTVTCSGSRIFSPMSGVVLAPASALGAGNGGVHDFGAFAGPLSCISSGTSSRLFVFSY